MNAEKLGKVLAAIQKVADDIGSGGLSPGVRHVALLVDGVAKPCCTHGHIQAHLGTLNLDGGIIGPLADALGLDSKRYAERLVFVADDDIAYAVSCVARQNDDTSSFAGRGPRIVEALNSLQKAILAFAQNHAQE